MLIRGMAPKGDPSHASGLGEALRNYANTIRPWARVTAKVMLADVARRDLAMWRANSQEMYRGLAVELGSAPTGAVLADLQQQQVELITSLPTEAAYKVHELAQMAMLDSTRSSEVSKRILNLGEVTKARATLIGRTEVSRASSNLVQARATYAGSDGYIWRTANDGNVRDSHKEMDGKYVRWSSPPTLDNLTGHAGTIPNCRCFADPVFPDD